MKYIDLLKIAVKDGFSVRKHLTGMDPIQRGFHQEALFNIFYLFQSKSNAKLIPSGGNFSGKTALSIKFDMVKYMNKNVRTGGDISDFTMIDYENNKLIVFSSKCLTKYGGGRMDIEKINEHIYDGFVIEVRLVVHDKKVFLDDMKNQRDTTPDRSNHVVYDWVDIQDMINIFEGDVSSVNKITSLYYSKYMKMRPRFGQYVVSMNIHDLLKTHKRVINGSICRFGKTYCMAFDILNSDNNLFVFITSQPKTITSISSIFNKYDDFKDYKLFNFNGGRESVKLFNSIHKIEQKTVVFVSIQTLKSNGKGKLIKTFKRFKPMCLIDEFHDSGETSSTVDIMKKHNLLESSIVFYSATYEKIKSFYKIPNNAIVSWGIEDNIWCSNVSENIENIRMKYGSVIDDALNKYTVKEIEDHYSTLPRLKFIVDKPSQKCLNGFGIKNKTDKSLGYSFDAVKMIKLVDGAYELVNENAVISYFQRMLGGGVKDEVFDVFVDQNGMIDTYKRLCDADGQKYGKIIPVYMGNGIVEGEQKDSSETIIYQCVECIIVALNKYKKTKLKNLDNYALINYDTSVKDPERWFDQIVVENPEKTIILFLGNSLTTGITNKYCDLIKLTRRIDSHELFWQTICRAMNESVERNKKYAYICIDDYQSLSGLLSVVKHMKHDGESEACAWKRLMRQNIFNIVDVDYDGKFIDTESYEPLFENVYAMVRNAVPYGDNLRRYIQDINFGDITLLSRYLVNLFKKDVRAELDTLVKKLEDLKKGIEKGIEIEKVEKKIEEKEKEVSNNDNSNCQEMLGVLITTYVMLTIEVSNINIVGVIDYLKENNKWSIMIERCCKSFGLDVNSSISTIVKLNTVLMDPKNINVVNETLATLKEQLRFDKSKQECYSICQEVIMTTDIERKQNAEVLTPLSLVNEMMSKIPVDAWTEMGECLPKIFDPCVGKGAFVVVIYDLLWDKLEELIPDEEERRVTILEEMIYFADINQFNIHVTKMILDPGNNYKLNTYCGDTLEMDTEEVFNVSKFDIIVGNPPYNDASGNKGSGHNIWTKFVKVSVNKQLSHKGYLSFVHPAGWRNVNNKIQHILKSKQLVYLELHDQTDGSKTFKASTRYDWYVLQNIPIHTKTIIKCDDGELIEENLRHWSFIPNRNFNNIKELIGEPSCEIIKDRSNYGTDKSHVQEKESPEFKYPCVYSVGYKGNAKFKWSKTNTNGHFGIPKVIFGSGTPGYISDPDGKYGLTEWCSGIVSDPKDHASIIKALQSDKFKNIIKAMEVSKSELNPKIMETFQKDFWKKFI
jgi:hypothetical protein